MKDKKAYCLLAAGLITALFVSGCGVNSSQNDQDNSKAESEKIEKNIDSQNSDIKGTERSGSVKIDSDAGKSEGEYSSDIAKTMNIEADHTIVLTSITNDDGTVTHQAQMDGADVPEFDYTWHADLAGTYSEVKDCPAEYFTGTKPVSDGPVYIAVYSP